jgi:hypothetical protein
VVITIAPTVAASRTRTLTALVSPFAPATGTASWRAQHPSVDVPAGMRGTALGAPDLDHNSIPATLRTVVPTAAVTFGIRRDVYNAVKQVAPPRGVPR